MRIWIFSGLALWLWPVMIVGGLGLGLPLGAAVPVGALVATALSAPLSALLDRSVGAALVSSRALSLTILGCTLAAVVQIASLSVFIADPHHARFSMSPGDPFRTQHSCMSSYAEAARFLAEGGHNIYEGTRYQPRFIGPLKVDFYHYPPPFLLIPQVLHAISGDFLRFRALWFVFQALVLVGTVVAVAAWVRQAGGAFALAGGSLLLAAPPVLYTLQQGNFQATAAPLAGLACMLIASRRLPAGAALLAYTAAAKIFPGIILVYLAAARRWRVLAWTAALGLVLVGATLLTQGTRPTIDFLTHALPEISSGTAFPHTEQPNTTAVNGSVYGMTVRLRRLGMTMFDRSTGMQV
ncbi:MAG TPA: glycosyltransferase family 87 protein, partial [Vicinamibacterales bacterium]|nr:glycosyltransferase family 87 protein [Vicinamibacterales bacterium]